ncbi:unnamed protein product [Pelagomonas calceolata]|uniref:Uncharacterized protein n=1 Tax=Pelagomonas calceolata TaxID=35677 RepID=A0A8J2WE06_9STRA|nr:unnamed protein product [Pelagomonas calceolata]|mmetsp:Transcript_8446/g.26404  ORF Transcript_8446/g.26404 Transcript_8446/m.26404 type:complete len:381 (-) Transcript_8446:28-1170(-)
MLRQTTLWLLYAVAQAMVATEPRSVLNEMQAAGAAVDATGFRAPRAACMEATEWEAPPEGVARAAWEECDSRERLAVKLARAWADGGCETPEASPDPLRPVYWDIDELRSLATPAATARARRDRRRRDKLRAMVDADSATKIDAAVDLVDARAARGNFGARGAARVRNVAGTLVAGALVATSTLPPEISEEIGRSYPFRLTFVVAALAALACRAPDAVLVPGAHLCAADGRNGLEPRYDAWRDEISYEGSVDDEPVRLAPPVASSSLDLLFDRAVVGGRSERSLVVDGAVALVGEDLRLRAPPFDPRDHDDPRDAAKHWKPFAAAPRDYLPFQAAARRDLAKLRAAKDVAPADDVSRRRRDLARAFRCEQERLLARFVGL